LNKGGPSSKFKYKLLIDSVKYCEGMLKENLQRGMKEALKLNI